jgi:hypothetical protein
MTAVTIPPEVLADAAARPEAYRPDVEAGVHDVRTGIAARLEQCLEALRERDRWINADPRRAQSWEDWRARHPVRVTPRRTR